MKKIVFFAFVLVCTIQHSFSQDSLVYKTRVLETTEVDFLSSYYSQDGDNAAVSGGIGDENLTDFTSTFIVAIPLNDDDVLTIDAGISAYTSASSSNINPFDSSKPADPFVASSGESSSDLWANLTGVYSHASGDRNTIWTAKASFSNEYDYTSIGVGGSITKLFNEKNTEISLSANAYFDTWKLLYPIELRTPGNNNDDDDDFNINDFEITGNPDYNPSFTPISDKTRNSYSAGLVFSQILSKKLQVSLAFDIVSQEGLLSTPYQRVYFADVEDSFIENFHLADDVERLPDTRFKVAAGSRLNYYINETFVVRTFYRYYSDDWGINSHTASIEVPIKLGSKFTIYPSYRYYTQTEADYFAPYNEHLSTSEFYTSDFDLSDFDSNQYGFGITYTDIFAKAHIFKFGLKSIDLKFYQYDRDSTFSSFMFLSGFNFVMN